MDRSIRNLLGLTNDIKRVYQFQDKSGEVTREEFEYSQIIHNVVFGEKGYVDTLGPTWNMVHDPRFMAIEGCFVVDRPAIFGGDARLGKQFITDTGMFTSTVNDLEQYSEILSEGRHFFISLTNMRIERALREATETGIHTESPQPMLGRKFKKPVIATAEAQDFSPCSLSEALETYALTKKTFGAKWIWDTQLTEDERATLGPLMASYADLTPEGLEKADDEIVWNFLRHSDNVPNYFAKPEHGGKPSRLAKMLFDSIRKGLVSLVNDYASIANVQEWITLETGDLVEEAQMSDAEIPRVWVEVDLLEKALTHRAVLRVTAAKIMNHQTIRRFLRGCGMDPEHILLTDVERDKLLQIIYSSNYPHDLHVLFSNLNQFIAKCLRVPLEERTVAQLAEAKAKSQAAVQGLADGSTLPITRYTEPEVELPETVEERLTRDIMNNPLRLEIFMLFTNCEKLKITEAVEILRQAATNPDFEVNEESFTELLEAAGEYLPDSHLLSQIEGIMATEEEKASGKAGNHII